MRMPFERLMEHVAALSDEDRELPMGKLSERWGEPAARIADAIAAVRVMRGERTYISLRPEEACAGTHCCSHNVDEPDEGTWLACLECRHVYRSPEELQREWAANAPPDLPGRDTPPPVEDIRFCPLCRHDW